MKYDELLLVEGWVVRTMQVVGSLPAGTRLCRTRVWVREAAGP